MTNPPSASPSISPRPSAAPSVLPSMSPSAAPTSLPSASPSDYRFPLMRLTQGNNGMDISPMEPLNHEAESAWEDVTRRVLEAEIYALIGENNVEELLVNVKVNSQEPPFSSPSPSSSPNKLPSRVPSEGPSQLPSFGPSLMPPRRVLHPLISETTTGLRKASGMSTGRSRHDILLEQDARPGSLLDERRTQAGNLNIIFTVDIFIRSKRTEHVINRYIGGGFDTPDDRLKYLTDLILAHPAFEGAKTMSVDLPDPPPPPTPAPKSSEGATTGIIVGLVSVSLIVTALGSFFVFNRRRQNEGFTKKGLAQSIQGGDMDRHIFISEIEFDEKGDMSTLGDPIPIHFRNQCQDPVHPSEQNSVADSFSLDYDFQKAQLGNGISLADISEGGTGNENLLVAKDDDTLEDHYFAADQFEVEAPPGKLWLVLETSFDGVPIVHAIKPSSPLATELRVGDRLCSVDGEDVSVMLASEVSRLIASKTENPVRRLVFTRPTRMPNFTHDSTSGTILSSQSKKPIIK